MASIVDLREVRIFSVVAFASTASRAGRSSLVPFLLKIVQAEMSWLLFMALSLGRSAWMACDPSLMSELSCEIGDCAQIL